MTDQPTVIDSDKKLARKWQGCGRPKCYSPGEVDLFREQMAAEIAAARDAFAAERIAEVNEVADDLAVEMGVRTGTAERERDAALVLVRDEAEARATAERLLQAAEAESAGRLKVLNEKADEARREWARAEAAEANQRTDAASTKLIPRPPSRYAWSIRSATTTSECWAGKCRTFSPSGWRRPRRTSLSS